MIVKHYDYETEDPDYSPIETGQGSLYQLTNNGEELEVEEKTQ